MQRPGYERIPDNWYTRNTLDPYTIAFLAVDSAAMLLDHPEFASVGGNTGTTNTFVGLDPGMLTGGIYDATTLLLGNNLFCFGLELGIQETPDILSGLFTDIGVAEDVLGPVINAVTDTLGCPTLNEINKGQFAQFPGYTNLGSDGQY